MIGRPIPGEMFAHALDELNATTTATTDLPISDTPEEA